MSIDQGDPFIENYVWKTREKTGLGWKGFWLNYGMNRINAEDFWNLVEMRECQPISDLNNASAEYEEEDVLKFDDKRCVFTLSVNENLGMERRVTEYAKRISNKNTKTAKIDFAFVNKKNKDLGTAGELLALKYEQNRLKSENIPYKAEYVANTIGDGIGYDILSYDENGNEIHIEVKTTRSANEYGFFMSKREIEESHNSIYKIYRVYNFDDENKTADMKIIDGKISEITYDMEATNYKILGRK